MIGPIDPQYRCSSRDSKSIPPPSISITHPPIQINGEEVASQLVAPHHVHGGRFQKAVAMELSTIEEHLGETAVVLCGGDETGPTCGRRRGRRRRGLR